MMLVQLFNGISKQELFKQNFQFFSWENKEETVYTKQIFKRNSFSKYTEICEGFAAFKVPVENAFIYGNKFPE